MSNMKIPLMLPVVGQFSFFYTSRSEEQTLFSSSWILFDPLLSRVPFKHSIINLQKANNATEDIPWKYMEVKDCDLIKL